MEDLQNTNWKYHVFLSFRGEDTRLGFTDHLYATLVRKGLVTFRDDEELLRGEIVSQKLLRAIEDSQSAIVIISKNYASSTWCLDELVKILESKHLSGQEVFPIFYGVDPSDVRNQRGSFTEAFRKHEEIFPGNKEKVQKWRCALREVANLSGWDSKNLHETKLIEEVVAQIWKKLELKLPTYNDGLVAIETKLEELYSTLKVGPDDVRFIGIWGMGGIGKTTLATTLFKKIRSKFDVSCFIADVREVSGEGNQGLLRLQNKILSHLNIKGMVIETLSQGKDNMRNLLSNQKVLLVLDDVSSKTQLENLAGTQEWFGRGSRIIVTTRDKHLLISHVVAFDMYESKILNKSESLQLFCEKAFKKDEAKEDYLELSKSVVEYAGGLPLALEVMGSFLRGRSRFEWEDALIKIKSVAHDDILNKLRISYDMLEDEHKTIFLDIACFFKGWYKHKVIQVLDNCGLHPTVGINVLIEKSLVTFDGRVIGMHDLVEEMGKTIVFQESPIDPGRRSRLWSLEDIDQVLRKNKGTECVQGIVLKSSSSMSYEAHWDPVAFSKMCNLRLLVILCELHLHLGLKCFSSSLKVLVWWGFPLSALPNGVQLNELVHLQMINSQLKQLGNRNQYFGNLKVIDLSNSKDLRQTPNVSGVPYLEEMYLNDCTKLVKVHESIRQHKKLMILSLMGCVNLRSFPSELEMCSLKMLFLSDCSKVERLADFGECMTSVSVLNLMHCRSLVCLPNSISNLKSLRILNISGCLEIDCLPNSINQNTALEDLDLSRTGIRALDPSLLQLWNLKRLSLSECSGTAYNSKGERRRPRSPNLILPHLLSSLSSLTVLDLSYCNLTDNSLSHDMDCLASLERLILSGNFITCVPFRYIANFSKLRCLELEDCPQLESLPLLPPHVRLYVEGSDAWDNLLDPEKIWKLFELNDKEPLKTFRLLDDSYHHPFNMFTEIPSRFDNQKFSPSSSSYVSEEFDSIASVRLDIPDDFHSTDGWGVAVFVALETPLPKKSDDSGIIYVHREMSLSWQFDHLEPGDGPSLSLFSSSTAYNDLYLFTMVVSGDFIYLERHTKGVRSSKRRKRFSKFRKPEFKKNSSLQFEVRVDGCKIRKCGWHVLRKEDYLEELQKVKKHGSLIEETSKSKRSNMSKSIMDEIKQEEDTTATAMDVLLHNKNFSLGKVLLNIRQGVCLIVLALISIMIGVTIFPSPSHGLGFREHTTTAEEEEEATSKLKLNWISYKTTAKINTPQLRRNHNIYYAKKQLSFPVYQSPRKLIISQSGFCSCISRSGTFCSM